MASSCVGILFFFYFLKQIAVGGGRDGQPVPGKKGKPQYHSSLEICL